MWAIVIKDVYMRSREVGEIWEEWEKLRWLSNRSRESQRWRHDQPTQDNWFVEGSVKVCTTQQCVCLGGYFFLWGRVTGFYNLLKTNHPPCSCCKVEISSQVIALITQSVCQGLVERILVFWSWMWCPLMILHSTTDDLSDCPREDIPGHSFSLLSIN